MAFVNSMPWLALGDFNEISYGSEKFGGAPIDRHRVNLFNDCMDYYNLIELAFLVLSSPSQILDLLILLFLKD